MEITLANRNPETESSPTAPSEDTPPFRPRLLKVRPRLLKVPPSSCSTKDQAPNIHTTYRPSSQHTHTYRPWQEARGWRVRVGVSVGLWGLEMVCIWEPLRVLQQSRTLATDASGGRVLMVRTAVAVSSRHMGREGTPNVTGGATGS